MSINKLLQVWTDWVKPQHHLSSQVYVGDLLQQWIKPKNEAGKTKKLLVGFSLPRFYSSFLH